MTSEVKVVQKRPPALKPFGFGCLKGTHSINVTRGCLHRCVYCYARGYPGTPGVVEVYGNLVELVHQELESPLKRKKLRLVVFNTASDSFQPHSQILDLTHRLMELLLKRGLPIYFLTKGQIPKRTVELLSEYRHLVFPQVGLTSLDQAYCKVFEPYAAPPEGRLELIREMVSIGITPEVRVDPLIPFLTDTENNLRKLFSSISDLGVRRVVLNYLHIRPGVEEIMKKELGRLWYKISSPYLGQKWETVGLCSKAKLLPPSMRKKKYGRIVELARTYGLEAKVCYCKNPDLGRGSCLFLPLAPWPLQLGLFN